MQGTKHIAIVGAGLMGHGIAHVLAAAGHEVRVFDRSKEAIESLPDRLAAIDALLGCDGKTSALISAHEDLAEATDDVEFVIEAATENLDVKRYIIAELEAFVGPETIIATNTSAIPIAQIAQKAHRPERVVGAHFWNPPHLVKLVEVVQAEATSDATIEKTIALFEDAGHRAVHVRKDVPGFIGNRLQHALKREAIALVANGVCDAKTVDDVVKCGFGQRLAVLGPLEQSDLVGLNLTQAIHETLMPDLDCTRTSHPYLQALVADGHTGVATGQGFYSWTDANAQEVRDRLNEFLVAASRQKKRD